MDRIRSPLDPFFTEGNEVCHLKEKEATIDLDSEELLHSVYPTYRCNEKGCTSTFDSIQAYEAHYNSIHCHTCTTCKRCFPTDHLLDMHIKESHDAYLQSLLAKGQAVFDCFVQSCDVKFTSLEERWEHLMKLHKYPSDFRFGRPTKKLDLTSSAKETMMDVECRGDNSAATSKKPEIHNKVPKSICFGQGSVRVFQRSSQSSSKQRHTKKGKDDQSSSITMMELETALEDV